MQNSWVLLKSPSFKTCLFVLMVKAAAVQPCKRVSTAYDEVYQLGHSIKW